MAHITQNAISNFRGQRMAIEQDKNLSDIGKKRQLERLDSEIAGYRDTCLIYQKGSWSRLRRAWVELADKKKQAQDSAARDWDYQRLNYQTSALEGQFKATSHDIEAIEKLYNSMASSGDRHKAKAAAELGASVLFSMFGEADKDAQRLARRMQKDLAELNDNEELRQIRQQESALAKELLELRDATEEAATLYGQGTFSGKDSEFVALLEGVKVQTKVQPDNPEAFMVTEVTIDGV